MTKEENPYDLNVELHSKCKCFIVIRKFSIQSSTVKSKDLEPNQNEVLQASSSRPCPESLLLLQGKHFLWPYLTIVPHGTKNCCSGLQNSLPVK